MGRVGEGWGYNSRALASRLSSAVEQWFRKPSVRGSNPRGGSIILIGEVERVRLDPAIWGTIFPELIDTTEAPSRWEGLDRSVWGTHPREPSLKKPRPILGFRINQIHFADLQRKRIVGLTGFGPRPYLWQPGKNVATCVRPRMPRTDTGTHQVPGEGCGCGFYAFYDLAHFSRVPSTAFVLLGVAGSGIIRLHGFGWRSQFARIVAFSAEMPPMAGLAVINRERARALEEKYHVPVVSLKNLRDTMRDAGDFVEDMP